MLPHTQSQNISISLSNNVLGFYLDGNLLNSGDISQWVVNSPAPPQAAIGTATFLAFSNLTVGGTYQLQKSQSWYWTNQLASFNASGSVHTQVVSGVASIGITWAGIGYPNTPTIRIAAPPADALSPIVLPAMRLNAVSLAPYDNYQMQFQPAVGGAWGNWAGGLFSPTGVTNSQYLFITNGVGFFRPHTRLALASHSDSLEFPKGRRGHCLWWTPP